MKLWCILPLKPFIASGKGRGHEKPFLLFLSFSVLYNSVEVLSIFKWVEELKKKKNFL